MPASQNMSAVKGLRKDPFNINLNLPSNRLCRLSLKKFLNEKLSNLSNEFLDINFAKQNYNQFNRKNSSIFFYR